MSTKELKAFIVDILEKKCSSRCMDDAEDLEATAQELVNAIKSKNMIVLSY